MKPRTYGPFPYSPIIHRPKLTWPGGAHVALWVIPNIEFFALDEKVPPAAGGSSAPVPDVPQWAARDYGNRVGVWRCLDLFDQLKIRVGALVNTALYDHCPEVVDAFVKRGDELIGHGHTNSVRQGEMQEAEEKRLLQYCRERIRRESGAAVAGWLSPWISESALTPDLLAETGYRYTLNWCHDDQPTEMKTRSGRLWSIPYPQELNDIPMIIARQMDARDFADVVVDNFDEMLEQSHAQPLVMGIALHPYIVGQPYRLRHVRRALEHIQREKRVWWTTPGEICDWVSQRSGPEADFFS